jgi:hypothetical protein
MGISCRFCRRVGRCEWCSFLLLLFKSWRSLLYFGILTNADFQWRDRYSEAIPILYSTNTFSFIDLDCLRYLSATILPSRFQAIKKLEIEWYLTWPLYDDFAQRMLFSTSLYPPHDEATWEEIWRIIAGMAGLQKLRVELNYFDGFRDDECENKMLAPLRQVKGVRDFVVNLGWSGKEVTGASFKVERPVVVGVDESDEDW